MNLLARLIGLASLLPAVISATASGAAPPPHGQRIAIDPKVASLVKQAASALKVEQYDLAIRYLTAVLAMKPEQNTASAIYAWRAGAYGRKGELNRAMDDASESIRLNPRSYRGYLERGVVYRRTGRLDKAISDYDTAVRLNPHFGRIYYDRAIAYGLKGNYNQSIRDNTEAIRLRDPDMEADFYL